MNKFFSCLLVSITIAAGVQAQKFDSTVKMNGEGYRVACSNKELDNNYVTIYPVRLNLTNSRQIDFAVKGIVTKIATDDLTEDGEPDLVICVYSGTNNEIGNIIGVAYSKAEKMLKPVKFPDIYSDPKLREGYKGHDVYSLVIGTVMRKFPIYLPNDAPDKPTGGIRNVQYKIMNEQGQPGFKVLRTFDSQPEQ